MGRRKWFEPSLMPSGCIRSFIAYQGNFKITIYAIRDSNEKKEVSETMDALLRILRYIKPYESQFFRDEKMHKSIKIYDEREWRYVVSPEKSGGKYFLTKEEFRNSVTKAQANEKLKDAKLGFEPEDIKYIIVKGENERMEMIKALKDIKKPKYNEETIEILFSRILTCDQMEREF